MTPEQALRLIASGQVLAQINELEPLEPLAALSYFKSLIPKLGVDPERWLPDLRRHAFTSARLMEQTLLERTKQAIYEEMKTGVKAQTRVADILNEVGTGPRDDSYSEMCIRTNVLDALNQGSMDEVQSDPMMMEEFPCWLYLGIEDGREGEDHRPNFNHVFPNTMTFAEVRGARPFRCRCTSSWIHKSRWAEMQRQGWKLTTIIPREVAGYA